LRARCSRRRDVERLGVAAAELQGLTLVHLSAQPEHFLWDKLSGRVASVTKTAQVDLESGRV